MAVDLGAFLYAILAMYGLVGICAVGVATLGVWGIVKYMKRTGESHEELLSPQSVPRTQ